LIITNHARSRRARNHAIRSRRATLKFVLQSGLGLIKPYKIGLLDEDFPHFILILSLIDVGLGFSQYTTTNPKYYLGLYVYNMVSDSYNRIR